MERTTAGTVKILTDPLLKRFVDTHLADELARFRNAWIVPFGPNASAAVESVSDRAGLDCRESWRHSAPQRATIRIATMFSSNSLTRRRCRQRVADQEVVRRSEALKAKVSRHLGRPYSPPPLPSNVEGKTARTPTVRNILPQTNHSV